MKKLVVLISSLAFPHFAYSAFNGEQRIALSQVLITRADGSSETVSGYLRFIVAGEPQERFYVKEASFTPTGQGQPETLSLPAETQKALHRFLRDTLEGWVLTHGDRERGTWPDVDLNLLGEAIFQESHYFLLHGKNEIQKGHWKQFELALSALGEVERVNAKFVGDPARPDDTNVKSLSEVVPRVSILLASASRNAGYFTMAAAIRPLPASHMDDKRLQLPDIERRLKKIGKLRWACGEAIAGAGGWLSLSLRDLVVKIFGPPTGFR